MIGGGTGPADGTNATTCTPGPRNLKMMLKAAEEYPMNLGFLGKGNCSDEAPLIEQVKAGAMGLKIHEDWGATPAVINHCLNVADEYDVQVAIHTDTLNEGGCVEDTLAAIGGRTIHTYHTEGARRWTCTGYHPRSSSSERTAIFHKPNNAIYSKHSG